MRASCTPDHSKSRVNVYNYSLTFIFSGRIVNDLHNPTAEIARRSTKNPFNRTLIPPKLIQVTQVQTPDVRACLAEETEETAFGQSTY